MLHSLIFLHVTICLSLFYLFQCEKKVFKKYRWAISSTYCTEVGKGRSPAEPVSRAEGRRAGRGKQGSRAASWGVHSVQYAGGEVEQAGESRSGRGE